MTIAAPLSIPHSDRATCRMFMVKEANEQVMTLIRWIMGTDDAIEVSTGHNPHIIASALSYLEVVLHSRHSRLYFSDLRPSFPYSMSLPGCVKSLYFTSSTSHSPGRYMDPSGVIARCHWSWILHYRCRSPTIQRP
ncbi:hypothetical protein BJ912DRAFT_1048416 [Pholiota molesta]|nr:hypothetical protein BJ912DRAFT_1048416 [Pholiota molesta]